MNYGELTMSIWANERTEIATWLSGYLSMVKTWVDKILDNEHYDVDKNKIIGLIDEWILCCLLYTSPSPRDGLLSRMPSSA